MDSNVNNLRSLAPDLERTSFTRIGGALIATKTPIESQLTDLLLGLGKSKGFGKIENILPIPPIDGRVPHTTGKIQSVGVADLLVVKQQLKGYEAADIAHVEIVLPGEAKGREHTDIRRTETTSFTETELSTAEEHEIGSTNRYEMSKESAVTLKEDASLKAGLQVTAKYGPFVEVSPNVEGAVSRNREEVNKSASKFSQDVTARTAKTITERTLLRQTFTTGNELTEKNSHSINNASGTGNISGVYQWVNKVYEAQVFNYGLRTMFEFMVPEPAAFIMDAMVKSANQAGTGLEKPLDFRLTPDQITRDRYQSLVVRYEATDVVPPPEDFITKSDQVSKGGGDSNTNYNHGATIQLENGYEAVYAVLTMAKNIWGDDPRVEVFIGSEATAHSKGSPWIWRTKLDKEEREIAWGFNTWRTSDITVAVRITCRATERSFKVWQADTHAKLLNAYKARLQEYEEKLATLKLQTGIAIEGR